MLHKQTRSILCQRFQSQLEPMSEKTQERAKLMGKMKIPKKTSNRKVCTKAEQFKTFRVHLIRMITFYFKGMCRGLLGKESPVQLRQNRKDALKEADVVILAGNFQAHELN